MPIIYLNHFIHPTYISALGIKDEYIYYFFILVFLMVCYNVIQPLMAWFIQIKSIKLLSYLFSSLLVMCFILVLILKPDIFGEVTLNLIEITLKSLAIFGIGLFVYRTFHQFMNHV